jgi:hypothetical protein
MVAMSTISACALGSSTSAVCLQVYAAAMLLAGFSLKPTAAAVAVVRLLAWLCQRCLGRALQLPLLLLTEMLLLLLLLTWQATASAWATAVWLCHHYADAAVHNFAFGSVATRCTMCCMQRAAMADQQHPLACKQAERTAT